MPHVVEVRKLWALRLLAWFHWTWWKFVAQQHARAQVLNVKEQACQRARTRHWSRRKQYKEVAALQLLLHHRHWQAWLQALRVRHSDTTWKDWDSLCDNRSGMLDDVVVGYATRMRSLFDTRDNQNPLRCCRQALCTIRVRWGAKYCKELVEIDQRRLIPCSMDPILGCWPRDLSF